MSSVLTYIGMSIPVICLMLIVKLEIDLRRDIREFEEHVRQLTKKWRNEIKETEETNRLLKSVLADLEKIRREEK